MKLRLQIGLLLAMIASVWAVYVVLLGPRLGWAPALLVGFLGSIFLLVLVSAVVQLVRALLLRRLLARAGPPRGDGYSACSGRVVAVDEAVPSPLAGEPCVAWEYEFQSGDQETEWSGIGQVAMAIESEGVRVPIRCGLMVESLAWQAVSGSEGQERAADLAAAPRVRETSGPSAAAAAIEELEQLLNDTDGSTRLDWRRGPNPPRFRANACQEKRLEPGALVTVLGRYSLTERAFVPSARGFELHLGSAQTLRSESLQNAIGMLGIALFLNLFIQGMTVLAYLRPPG